jgi:hypothetical protein
MLAACTVLDVTGTRISAGSQAQVQKADATVELVLGQPRVIVHLTNKASLAVEAWQLRVDYQLVSGSRDTLDITTDTCFNSSPPGTPGSGAILREETREQTISLPGVPLSASVSVRMLLFEDLSFEGSADEVSFLRVQRDRHATTLGTWIDALQAVAGKTDAEAKAVLRDVLASERTRADSSDSRAAGTLQTIAEFLESNRSDSKFSDQVTALRQRFERERERAVRRQARNWTTGSPALSASTVSSTWKAAKTTARRRSGARRPGSCAHRHQPTPRAPR